MNFELIRKYNVPGPRYTSYPTVPYWQNSPTQEQWKTHIADAFERSNSEKGISVYVHLPFCERLCTYCGCHKLVTKKHDVEEPYIDALLKEWTLYRELFNEKPIINELHLGGGTPTFFSPENLEKLNLALSENTVWNIGEGMSFEGHPANTSSEHLQTLYNMGYRRVSFGIQDFDPIVQKAINRFQSIEQVHQITESARNIGYTSVNFDMIYGLPFQSVRGMEKSFEEVLKLRPERMAFYSYAHVPWKERGQRLYNENDLPSGEKKRELYESGREMLEAAGYLEIGMDHFALPSDSLAQAFSEQRMHRNFMGYTTTKTEMMIGLGASSISDSLTAFAQNEKNLKKYHDLVKSGEIPIYRGHILSDEDLAVRRHITELMCHFETSWADDALEALWLNKASEQLQEIEKDGLAELRKGSIKVTQSGKPFVRNICMALDKQLHDKKPETKLFSMTV